jgi:hypothetical protein
MQGTYKNPCEDCILYVKCSTPCKKLIDLQNIVANKIFALCYSDDSWRAKYYDAVERIEIVTEMAEEYIQPNIFKSVTITTDQVGVELNDGSIFNMIISPGE